LAEPRAASHSGEPITLRDRPGHLVRVAAQSFLLMAVIVAMTFALLVLLDRAGVQISPTGDMLAIDRNVD
jgi:hypothetical protein